MADVAGGAGDECGLSRSLMPWLGSLPDQARRLRPHTSAGDLHSCGGATSGRLAQRRGLRGKRARARERSTAELDPPGASQMPGCCKHQSSSRAASGRAAGCGQMGPRARACLHRVRPTGDARASLVAIAPVRSVPARTRMRSCEREVRGALRWPTASPPSRRTAPLRQMRSRQGRRRAWPVTREAVTLAWATAVVAG
jgi:hypothetical protein